MQENKMNKSIRNNFCGSKRIELFNIAFARLGNEEKDAAMTSIAA